MKTENLREKLHTRKSELDVANHEIFHEKLKRFWGFLQDHSVFVGIVQDLDCRRPDARRKASSIVNNNERIEFKDELDEAAVACKVIHLCAQSPLDQPALSVGRRYGGGTHNDDALERFREVILEPFIRHIDEQLDYQHSASALLIRYKHKCEWFNRSKLFTLWKDNTQKGETLLKTDLYEYLFDQGVEIQIEPSSASGEVDFLKDQIGEDLFLAEVKIFNPSKSKGKPYIISGFQQLYRYLEERNELFGYLVIYNTSENDLSFKLSNLSQLVPFVTYNNKIIFILTINISSEVKSASKRGKLKTTEITEEELINVLDE